MRDNFDPRVTWDDLQWVRERWMGPVILKGVMNPSDAQRAAALGLEGIVVSNHGGRQLDGARATADVLPAIAAAVGDRMTVLVDGGVRSGLDVVKMLSLGADAVLLGRAWVYALAVGGQVGVAHAIDVIRKEIIVAQALMGLTRPDELRLSALS
jgi:L-lactate dehydrogenase (cytochrome)